MSTTQPHDADDIRRRIQTELPHWRYEDGQICRQYRTGGWKGTLMAVNAVGHLAEVAWHHPDLAVSYDSVTVKLSTHSVKGVTDCDFELARRIEDLLMWRPAPDSALEGTPDDPRFKYIEYD